MNITLTRRAIRAIPRTAHATRAQTNDLRRKWLRAVRYLGAKWRAIPRPQHAGDAAVFAVTTIGALSVMAGDAHAANVIDVGDWLWLVAAYVGGLATALVVLTLWGDKFLTDEDD